MTLKIRSLSKLASVSEAGEGSERRTAVYTGVHEDLSTEPTNKFSSEVKLRKRSIEQGQIWLANLNPSRGTEAGKTRPVLIFQDQALLDILHPSTLIIPLTTQLIDNAHPLRIRVEAQDALKQSSDLLIDQIRAIDNKRLITGPLTSLSKKQLKEVFYAVAEVIGISEA